MDMGALATERPPQSKPGLTGNMGFLELFFSVMAYNAPMVVVIGVIPIMVATGGGIATPISFVVAGIILGFFAVGFTRMARILPNPGGLYALITAGLGRKVGLGSGLLALLSYFCVYAGTFSFGGVVLGELVHGTFGGPDLPWYLWAAVFWAGSSILGYLNVELSAKFLTFFLLAEMLVIVAYDVLVAGHGGASGLSLAPFSPSHWFDGSFGLGLLFAVGMYGGFEVAVLFREEVRNPIRTVPRATYAVIGAAMSIYAVTAWLFINSFGVDKIMAIVGQDPAGAMTTSLQTFGGKLLFDLATTMVNTSTFAVILAAHNITARYIFNLGADSVLPNKMSAVHKKHKSPHLASVATSIGALVLNGYAVFAGLDPIAFYTAMLGLTSFAGMLIIFLSNLSVGAFLRRHRHEVPSLFASTISPAIAAIGLGAAVVLAAVNFPMLVGGSDELAIALMIVIVGLFVLGIVLAAVYQRKRPAVYSSIGRQ